MDDTPSRDDVPAPRYVTIDEPGVTPAAAFVIAALLVALAVAPLALLIASAR